MADGARGGMEAGEARRHALFVNPHAVNQVSSSVSLWEAEY